MPSSRTDAARSLADDLRHGRVSSLPIGDLALLGLGILYMVSPIDFMPEVLLGPLGIVDDMGVLALVMVKVTMMLDRRAVELDAPR